MKKVSILISLLFVFSSTIASAEELNISAAELLNADFGDDVELTASPETEQNSSEKSAEKADEKVQRKGHGQRPLFRQMRRACANAQLTQDQKLALRTGLKEIRLEAKPLRQALQEARKALRQTIVTPGATGEEIAAKAGALGEAQGALTALVKGSVGELLQETVEAEQLKPALRCVNLKARLGKKHKQGRRIDRRMGRGRGRGMRHMGRQGNNS